MNKIIVIPVADGKLSQHFGHCEAFYFASVENNSIIKEWYVTPPAHEPGLYPAWVKEQGASVIIAGGMGKKACDMFKINGVEVYAGAASEAPDAIVKAFLDNTLQLASNACEHHAHTCKH